MRLQKFIFGLTLSLMACAAVAQRKVPTLGLGEPVPDLLLKHIINGPPKQAHLSDYRGKLVILDMWSTWCTSCIAAFPKMQALQDAFKDSIQIILVNAYDPTYESEEKIRGVLARLKTNTGFVPRMPVAIHDTILNHYFPHVSVPHVVVIGADRKVAAITDHWNITSENIRLLLQGKGGSIPLKNDLAFDKKTPLLVNGNGGSAGDFLYRSMFTGYKPGVTGAGTRVNNQKEVTGFYIGNTVLRRMIEQAFTDVRNASTARLLVELSNAKQQYCYDLVVPPTPWKQFDVTPYLRGDLERFFHIKVLQKEKEMRCVVVSGLPFIPFDTVRKRVMKLDHELINKYIHHYPVKEILNFLENYCGVPFIDETGAGDRVLSVDFPENFEMTADNVVQFLRSNGFLIAYGGRKIPVISITDH